MQERDSSQDPRVSRGPAQPDGGVQNEPIGPGGRGVSTGEDLDEVQQQAGLDAPYGSRAADREHGTLRYYYAEETYYFDSQQCLDRFAEQPEVFLSHPGEDGDTGFDRAQRPEGFQHRGELKPGTPHTLEQPRVESGSG